MCIYVQLLADPGYIYIYINTGIRAGWGIKSTIDSRLIGPRLRLDHFRVGEESMKSITLVLRVWFKL